MKVRHSFEVHVGAPMNRPTSTLDDWFIALGEVRATLRREGVADASVYAGQSGHSLYVSWESGT